MTQKVRIVGTWRIEVLCRATLWLQGTAWHVMWHVVLVLPARCGLRDRDPETPPPSVVVLIFSPASQILRL
jgi:hypothetical protein